MQIMMTPPVSNDVNGEQTQPTTEQEQGRASRRFGSRHFKRRQKKPAEEVATNKRKNKNRTIHVYK